MAEWKDKYPHLSGIVEGGEESSKTRPDSDVPEEEVPRVEKSVETAAQSDEVEDQAPKPETVSNQTPPKDSSSSLVPQPEMVDDVSQNVEDTHL